ncbi:serine/threonine-protein kinase [Streptomyces fuscichromogenes]|uniref:serine/threonine-protein kinase n=1 Tax=Streptomyces fuscichromogenes TaxID=1324013 RepID=UPI003824CC16
MSEDGEQPVEGRLIGGRYRLTERIGSGPTGTVWRARDEQDGQDVAVKEPRLAGDTDNEERQRAAHRLLHEARAAARVDHPAAVAIHDVCVEDELPWIVMELVEGEALHAALAARGPLPAPEAARIGLAVLGALHAAHGVGIVHRDLKPSNVLLAAGGERVVVTDFGIGAGPQGQGDGEFAAPECGAGHGAGPASDLWSLGALLRTMADDAAGPLGPLLEELLAFEPEARPAAPETAEALAEIAGVSLPAWATEPPAVPVPASDWAPAPDSAPAPDTVRSPSAPDPEPRRLTPFAALGLLLAKKPERG